MSSYATMYKYVVDVEQKPRISIFFIMLYFAIYCSTEAKRKTSRLKPVGCKEFELMKRKILCLTHWITYCNPGMRMRILPKATIRAVVPKGKQ